MILEVPVQDAVATLLWASEEGERSWQDCVVEQPAYVMSWEGERK
jgi:hypothetical protein